MRKSHTLAPCKLKELRTEVVQMELMLWPLVGMLSTGIEKCIRRSIENERNINTYPYSKNASANASSNKSLNRLVWREFNQWGLTHGFSENEGHNIIDHD